MTIKKANAMKKRKLIMLTLVGTALLLVPRRSSRKSNDPKRTSVDNSDKDYPK